MKIFDFNVHLVQNLEELLCVSVPEMRKNFHRFIEEAPEGLEGANFMIFNSALLFSEEIRTFISETQKYLKKTSFTELFDFRKNPGELLEIAQSLEFRAIKFHSLQQKISEKDFPLVLHWAREAEIRNFIILVDASVGTPSMYRYDSLKLVAYLAENLKKAPMVILHSGGFRAFEALLIALYRANTYLETSFSLPFFKGSSIEEDLAFAYRKIGPERVIYASDHPFVHTKESLDIFLKFAYKYNFSDKEIENMLYFNAQKLLNLS